MNKIKIVYIINSLKRGGPVNMLYTLVKYMDYDNYDINIISLTNCDKENKCDFTGLKCNIIQLESGKGIGKNTNEIKKIIKNIAPHIIHSHGGVADYICSKMSNEYVTFSTVHCFPEEDFIMKHGRFLGKVKSSVFYYNLSSIKNPIACSKTVANKIENCRNMKIDYIQNGIDYSLISNISSNENIINIENEKTDSSIVFVFCGYLSKRKNVKFLIEAFSMVKRKDIKLIILGNGDQFEEISNIVKNDERIIMVGKVSHPVPYLKVADCFLSASLSEGLPLAVMEGLACGLPAILSNIDSHCELKEIDDKVIKLFDLNDIHSLVNILENASKKEYENLSNRATNIIKEKLNSKIMVAKYCDYYKNSLKNE